MRKRAARRRRSLHLLVRMHLLRTLFARNEKRLPELRWRTLAPTAASGRGIVDRWPESAGYRTLRILCIALRCDLFALNSYVKLRVELHLLPARAESCRQRRPAI